MMKKYFRALKYKVIVPNRDRLKKDLINQLHTDIELGVKSPNYYDLGVDHEQAEKDRLIKKFKNMAPGIRGGEKVGTNKVLNIGPDEHHSYPHEIKGTGDQVMVQLGEKVKAKSSSKYDEHTKTGHTLTKD